MKVEVINSNCREQRYCFDVKFGEDISMNFGHLMYFQATDGKKAEIKLSDISEFGITSMPDYTAVTLRAIDFDAFRNELKKEGINFRDFIQGSDDDE